MNSKKWMAWLLCWTGALALAQTTGGAIETSAGRIEVLGQNFQALAPIGPSQTRIVVYSLPDNRLPGATSIFVNGAYHASLIKGAYSDLCYSPGPAEIGARQTEVGQRPKDQPDTITALSLQGARTYFLRVREQSGRPLLQPVAAEQALQELPKERLQQHTISRVAQDCITTAGVEPVQNEPAARHTLQSDTLFAFGRSDRAGLTVAGFSSIDQLMARLRADYSRIDRLHIVGHADPLGDNAINERLAIERANTVRQYIDSTGQMRVPMTAEGRGSRELVVTQCSRIDSPQARLCNAPNRRVVIEVNGQRR